MMESISLPGVRYGSVGLAAVLLWLHCVPVKAGEGVLPIDEYVAYDIRWGFLSLGTASLTHRVHPPDDEGAVLVVDTMEAKSHGWVSLIRKIDNRITASRLEKDGTVLTSTVEKKLHQGSFRQDDVLQVASASGRAVWSNRIDGQVHAFEVPAGTKDYIALIFDLRRQSWSEPGASTRLHLVMDRSVHDMELTTVATGMVKTAFGEVPGTRVAITSRSKDLFAHNRPEHVWISSAAPIILSMDARTPVGRVRTVLTRWTVNGEDRSCTLRPPAAGKEP